MGVAINSMTEMVTFSIEKMSLVMPLASCRFCKECGFTDVFLHVVSCNCGCLLGGRCSTGVLSIMSSCRCRAGVVCPLSCLGLCTIFVPLEKAQMVGRLIAIRRG